MAKKQQVHVATIVEEVPVAVVETPVEVPTTADVEVKVEEAWRGLHNFLAMFQSIQYLKDHVAGINEVVQNARVYITDSQARIHAQELVENDFVERLAELRAQVANWRETVAAKQAELDNEIHTQRTALVGELEAHFEQLNSTKTGLEAEVENLRELKIRRETEYNALIQTSMEELAALEGRVRTAREKLETLRRDIASIMKEN